MSAEIGGVLLLTLRVATVATAVVLPPALLLAYALARREFRGKRLVSALTALPLVLPPTAVGFLLLRALAVDGPLGRETLGFDLGGLLTWRAAVLAAITAAFVVAELSYGIWQGWWQATLWLTAALTVAVGPLRATA